MPDNAVPEIPRPSEPAIAQAIKSGGFGILFGVAAYGLSQAYLLPPLHASMSAPTVDAWVLPTLDLLIPGTILGAVTGTVTWLGVHSRDIVYAAKQALKKAQDPTTPERVEDVVTPSVTTQVIAKIAP